MTKKGEPMDKDEKIIIQNHLRKMKKEITAIVTRLKERKIDLGDLDLLALGLYAALVLFRKLIDSAIGKEAAAELAASISAMEEK
jgi:hypothetical protein